jgi:F-type H+-transporting ATPase subunit gamma
MESAETLQRRMGNLTDLQQIVRTMKALSAVSIRQYERAAYSLAEYERTVALGLRVVLRGRDQPHLPRRRIPSRSARIVFGTDHGLCGRFNEVIAEHALSYGDRHYEAEPWLAVGERVAAILEEPVGGGIKVLPMPGSAAAITALVQQVLLRMDAWRQVGVGRVELFHNRPTARSGYEPHAQRLFPLELRDFRSGAEWDWPSRRLPRFSMDRERLLGRLLRQHYFVLLFRACAESLAAEHGSRLAAMQAAEKNIDERLEEVTGRFRRVRQESITSELLDVVAGFEAVQPG